MKRPKVGVSTIIRQEGKVLMCLRKVGHARGMWGFPGGHMEGGESFQLCALREVEEEVGLILPSCRLWTTVNTIFHLEQKHYVVLFMVADLPAGLVPWNVETEKCGCLSWFPWAKLPAPLMQGIQKLVDAGQNPMGF